MQKNSAFCTLEWCNRQTDKHWRKRSLSGDKYDYMHFWSHVCRSMSLQVLAYSQIGLYSILGVFCTMK